MNGRIAGLIFLAACAVLAVLLLSKIITPLIGGLAFGIALALLGGISGGFFGRDRHQSLIFFSQLK